MKQRLLFHLLLWQIVLLLAFGCNNSEKPIVQTKKETKPTKRFVKLSANRTNIDFANELEDDRLKNILTYQYFYNGGGVAAADFNNDGKTDLFFTGNTTANKLYLNRGNLKFEDVSLVAGVRNITRNSWCTGVTVADVNADGWQDIYVCRAGRLEPQNRQNLLYINLKNGSFAESAARYGLNDPGYSVQAAFFDYDKDGDLDMYLVNHGMDYYGRTAVLDTKGYDPYVGDKLYRNDDGKFKDISQEAGIIGTSTSYGLGVGIADLNQDGWEDIYVSNDFFQNDYLYLNQKDGTFKEQIKEVTRQISFFGMGVDIADYNNDTLADIVVLDMTPEDHYRRHANLDGIAEEKFWDFVDKGYHYQYMFNSLNLNNGITPEGKPSFSNIARLAGMPQTDWSWAPLLADFDNDGYKDLFISNGLGKDVLNLDFINYANESLAAAQADFLELPEAEMRQILNAMPSEKVHNYVYKNQGDLTFKEVSEDWGFGEQTFSNGAAFADLDNDGDLDLVINNLNEQAAIYQNTSEQKGNHFIKLKIKGSGQNPSAIGAKVYLKTANGWQTDRIQPSRGFQSAVSQTLHFGLGKNTQIEQLKVVWPSGNMLVKENIQADKLYEFSEAQAKDFVPEKANNPQPFFRENTTLSKINDRHRENDFDDFDREKLLPYKLSTQGPVLAKGDVNGDGLDDFYRGSASGYTSALFIQNTDGTFRQMSNAAFVNDKKSEDAGAAFFDADNDGDLDLYVASGSNEILEGSPSLNDRLYLNNGQGKFTKSPKNIPQEGTSSSCVLPTDFDNDGDIDVFVGGGVQANNYPFAAASTLLINQGGSFEKDETVAPMLSKLGMVKAGVWADVNADGIQDLLLAGEWMPLTLLLNQNGKLTKASPAAFEQSAGFWSAISAGDFDSDGDLDFIAGNMGLNYHYTPTVEAPLGLYAADFDENTDTDVIITYRYDGKEYPTRDRNELFEQMNFIKKKYPKFEEFARASVQNIFTQAALDSAFQKKAFTSQSTYIENKGDGSFALHPLPMQAQFSTVNGIVCEDVNDDGNLDAILTGNLYDVETQSPRLDAGNGLVLLGNGKGNFEALSINESGFYTPGNAKSLVLLKGKRQTVIVGNNNARTQVFKLNEKRKVN